MRRIWARARSCRSDPCRLRDRRRDRGRGDPGVPARPAGGGAHLTASRLRRRRDDGRRGPDASASALVFLVLFVHSLPEGLAVGTAFASDRAGLSLFVILAIAIQNVPEGTSIALPMHDAGFSPWRQFWVAVGTSIPQPIGAVVAWLAVEAVSGLLPISFGFAAGAMLTIVAIEMVPRALADRPGAAVLGAILGGAAMGALSLALGV